MERLRNKMDILQWIQEWYNRFCWDEERHYYGIKIETLDNPGWSVKIEICDTPLENKSFGKICQDNGDSDWIFCKVEDGFFYGAGDPNKLISILEVFRDWAEQ